MRSAGELATPLPAAIRASHAASKPASIDPQHYRFVMFRTSAVDALFSNVRASDICAAGYWEHLMEASPGAARSHSCKDGRSVCYDGAKAEEAARMKILVIEDDKDTGDYVRQGLVEHGHVVDLAVTGRDGLFLAAGETYDIIIADRRLPGIDGLSIVKTIRSGGVRTPVIFLTTMTGVGDRVEGLEAGADDYLVKPFAFTELVARINALARRPAMPATESVLKIADLEMDLIAHRVRRAGRDIDVQPREFRLLEFLMRNAGKTVTRTMLLENVWDFHFDPKTNIVETHISRLRSKIDKGFDAELIETVRGSGYQIRAPR
jgi:two-component system OmpR family response regulator